MARLHILACCILLLQFTQVKLECKCDNKYFGICPSSPDPVLEGDSVRLRCEVKNLGGEGECFWSLGSTSQMVRNQEENSCDLLMSNLTYKNNDKYKCEAFLGSRSTSVCSNEVQIQVATILEDDNVYIYNPSQSHINGRTKGGAKVPTKGGAKVPQNGGAKVPPNGGANLPPKGGTKLPPNGGAKLPQMGPQHNYVMIQEDESHPEIKCEIYRASLTPTATFLLEDTEIYKTTMQKKLTQSPEEPPTYEASLVKNWTKYDNGKQLKCEVEYMDAKDLDQHAEAKVSISVIYPPSLIHNYFYIKRGQKTTTVVDLEANPPLQQDEVFLDIDGDHVSSGRRHGIFTYERAEQKGTKFQLYIVVDATDIKTEKYRNVTVIAKEEQGMIYFHIADNPDKEKQKHKADQMKGGSKGKGHGHQSEHYGHDHDHDDEDEDGVDAFAIGCIITVIAILLAAAIFYLIYRNRMKKRQMRMDTTALYTKEEKKPQYGKKDLSAIQEEQDGSSNVSVEREKMTDGEQKDPEGMTEEREVVEKPVPAQRTREGPDAVQQQTEQ